MRNLFIYKASYQYSDRQGGHKQTGNTLIVLQLDLVERMAQNLMGIFNGKTEAKDSVKMLIPKVTVRGICGVV